MELALCQERKNTKLFIRGIKWTEIINALKDEEVKVDFYEVLYDNDFTNDPPDKIVISNFSISNYHTLFGEIINLIVSLNQLKEVETIDLERLKAGFPDLVEQGLSLDEIWARFFRTNVEREMPAEVRLGNEAFYLEGYPGLESFLLTFSNKDTLISFIANANLILSEQTSEEFILAAKEEKPYATDGFKAVFEEAGKESFIALFQNHRAASEIRPSKANSVELAISNRHNYLTLFMEGLQLKELSKFLENETTYVSELEFIVDDSYNIESHDFKKGEDFYVFNPQKILFGNLIGKIEGLNLPENTIWLFSLKLRTSSFELDSRSSPPVYDLTFWRKEAMTDFLDSLRLFVSSEIIDEMKIALMEGKSYSTQGWMEDVEKASNECRIDCMIGLLEHIWVVNEEHELVKALKIVTGGETYNNEEEFKLTDAEKRIYGSGRPWQRPHLYFLVYNRLKEDRMKCFDGDGKIYGFDGELVINSVIANFSQSKSEIKQEMETLLTYYKEKFHQFNKMQEALSS